MFRPCKLREFLQQSKFLYIVRYNLVYQLRVSPCPNLSRSVTPSFRQESHHGWVSPLSPDEYDGPILIALQLPRRGCELLCRCHRWWN